MTSLAASPANEQRTLASHSAAGRSPFLIEATGDTEAAEQAWAELEPFGSVFQSRRWLKTWRQTLGLSVGARPYYLIVRECSARRPVAFFPLSVRRLCGVKAVEFPDLGVSDYNAPLCAPDFNPTDGEIETLWAQARHAIPGADVFLFERMPEALYGRPMPFARLRWLAPMALRCWTLALPANRDLYDTTVLKPRDRKEQRRKRRHLVEKLGEPILTEAATQAEAAEIFETLRIMRAERFNRQGRRDLLQEAPYARFYQAIAAQADDGFVSLCRIDAGGREVAALLGLRHAGAYALILHSFAPDLEALSPGVVGIDQLITHLIESGAGYCDFTTGNEAYKKQFGVCAGALRQGVDAVTPPGRLFAASYRALRWLRAASVGPLGAYARALRRLR